MACESVLCVIGLLVVVHMVLLFVAESSVLSAGGPLSWSFSSWLAAVCCAWTGRWSSCTQGYCPVVYSWSKGALAYTAIIRYLTSLKVIMRLC